MTKSSNKAPRVSVVMPAYNAEGFIGEVLATILGQTFKDFELVVLDDGSKDATADIIKAYAKMDKRVKYHWQANQGSANLGETINTAISLARGELIARADADDPWYLDKLELQVNFFDEHPEYTLVGGGADVTNERGVLLYTLLGPIDDDDNRRSLTLYTTLAHGSVMFKKSVFDKVGGYKNIHAAEDLELWQRMSDYGKIYNIPDPLFKYRKNTQGISMSNERLQAETVTRLGIEYFKSHRPPILSADELRQKLQFVESFRGNSRMTDWQIEDLLNRLINDNRQIAKLYAQFGDKKSYYTQLINIAISGKRGLKLVLRSIKGRLGAKLKSIWQR